MAKNMEERLKDPNETFTIYDQATGKRIQDIKGGIDVKDLEDIMECFEKLRLFAVQVQEERDARKTPEQLEALRKARAQEQRLYELQDIVMTDRRRRVPKYTQVDLIKKVLAFGKNGEDPEVLELFEMDENGEMSWENIKHVSNMLGPYVCGFDINIPGFRSGCLTFERLFCLPEMIERVRRGTLQMETEFEVPRRK